jgi:hypothetical protein
LEKMMTRTQLEIRGEGDEPVPHSFWRQERATAHLGILLPGVAYTCDMPLLYYPAALLRDRGADVLRLEYASERPASLAADQVQRLFAAVAAACSVALAQRDYQEITLVGKSLGTLAMGHLLTTTPGLARARAVWLTPLPQHAGLGAQIQRWAGRSLFVIGTADPAYDAARLQELTAATGGTAVVVNGADHSMEIAGDMPGSLAALTRIMEAIAQWLAAPSEGAEKA